MEQELQNVVDEVKDIETQTQSSARKFVKIEVTLFPKTVICLDGERKTVEQEVSGPIQAEIVDGEIKLNIIDPKNGTAN